MRRSFAYYNEFDPGAAEWLRELIKAGLIAPGEVDERSILDVRADELSGFTQCHFFAGIGGWSYALRRAGWPDDRPVWTGSPPCQPFSVAGEGKGRDDARHLSPHFLGLVRDARPTVLFGEQVASAQVFGKIAGGAKRGPANPPEWAWLDDLSDRLEASHYAVGASDIPAAGVGAPHIRQRTFFGAYDLRSAADGVGHTSGTRGAAWISEPAEREKGQSKVADNGSNRLSGPGKGRSSAKRLANLHGDGCHQGGQRVTAAGNDGAVRDGTLERMADSPKLGRREERENPGGINAGDCAQGCSAGPGPGIGHNRPNPLDGFWRDADWLLCRDGKWRPVEPGTFPLAHGLSCRVGLLRGYGNAISPEPAEEFIKAFSDVISIPLQIAGQPQRQSNTLRRRK